MSLYGRRVLSDPHAELAVKNAKYVKGCTELYLAKKGIEELAGFERFVNLETLWVNDNALRRLTGLDNNFRVKHLYAYHNRISSLAGSLRNFVFLESLHLFGNCLANLNRCLRVLSRLTHLHTLTLFDNPVAQEENYRLRVIFALPDTLEVLDNHRVKPEERAMAKLMFARTKKAAELPKLLRAGASAQQRPAAELVGELSGATVLLLEELEEIYARREGREAEQSHAEQSHGALSHGALTRSSPGLASPPLQCGNQEELAQGHSKRLDKFRMFSLSAAMGGTATATTATTTATPAKPTRAGKKEQAAPIQEIAAGPETTRAMEDDQRRAQHRMRKYALYGDRFRKFKAAMAERRKSGGGIAQIVEREFVLPGP